MALTQVTTYSLATVLKRVKQIIQAQTQNKFFWVRVQIAKIKNDRKGHYYLELIESIEGNIIAKCDATIWATQYAVIESKLKNDTPNILKDGSEVLCYATIEYSEIYGLRIQIIDIDLTYSLGEIEKRKQETLLYLQKNNLLHKNKQTYLPSVIQKIAIVGSLNTAGYADFTSQLNCNKFNFIFENKTFNCAVQGDKALSEIINTIKNIDCSLFDSIVIIRGGGSNFDLEIFNDLTLAQTIAQCNIPVITGIGHETDISVADIVAHKHLKTPTAVASFIIDRAHAYLINQENKYQSILETYKLKVKESNHKTSLIAEQIKNISTSLTQSKRGNIHQISNQISFLSKEIISDKKIGLNTKTDSISFLTKTKIKNNSVQLKEFATYINAYSKHQIHNNTAILNNIAHLFKHVVHTKINREKQRIEKLTHIPQAYNPQQILNLGYAIIRKNGKVITNKTNWINGDIIEIELADKNITFTITNTTEQKKWKDTPTKVLHQN